MKTSKHRRITPVMGRAALERDAQRRDQEHFNQRPDFLSGSLCSEPDLSFEQHLFPLVATNRLANGEERRRG